MWEIAGSTWGIFATVAASILLVVLRHLLGTRGPRNVLRSDIETLNQMPEGTGKDALAQSVQSQAARIAAESTELRRDLAGSTLGLIFLSIGAWMLSLAQSGPWVWYLPMVFFGTFGLFGIVEGLIQKRRDERGRAIKESASKDSEKLENAAP